MAASVPGPQQPVSLVCDASPSQDPHLDDPNAAPDNEESNPTDSHALADQTSAVGGKRNMDITEYDYNEVRDLGWNDDEGRRGYSIVQGLENDHLWALLRRFNKQSFRVRTLQHPPLANLDMNIADEEEFSPEKFRAHLERCYVSVAVPLFSVWNHIARLRSWNERNRTLAFSAVYAVAWLLDLLVPTTVLFVMLLILAPSARVIAFPPAPISLIDSKTGEEQTPPAGVLATDNTLTGAPEKVPGEGVEEEAHSFVNTLGSVALSATIGEPSHEPENETDAAPSADQVIDHVTEAKTKAADGIDGTADENTRQPASKIVWQQTRAFMRVITDLTDTWERLANALNPKPPFPIFRPRIKLAAVLLPMVIASYYTTPYMLTKGSGFALGLIIFGKPVLDRVVWMLEQTYPHWQRFVELRNSILKGVPTNAQLTITLLRVGEKNKAPLPPPPNPDAVAAEQDNDDTSDKNIADITPGDTDASQPRKRLGKGHKALEVLKSTVKGGVTTALAADRAKAFAGAHHAKERLGAVNYNGNDPDVGPVRFEARYKGKRGFAYITETSTTPALSWSPSSDGARPSWTILVSDIQVLRKVGGLAWPSKIVIGWSMHRQIVDGLVIEVAGGAEYHLTAILVRDELFNRLIALGDQVWELW